jgi:hypothetical protein
MPTLDLPRRETLRLMRNQERDRYDPDDTGIDGKPDLTREAGGIYRPIGAGAPKVVNGITWWPVRLFMVNK